MLAAKERSETLQPSPLSPPLRACLTVLIPGCAVLQNLIEYEDKEFSNVSKDDLKLEKDEVGGSDAAALATPLYPTPP